MDFKQNNIDGDLVVYQCAFAAESSNYILNKADGASEPYSDIRLLTKDLGENDEILKSIKIISKKEAIEILDRKVNAIIKAVNAENYTVYLSHKKRDVNRRNWIATQMPYKSDRGPKPFYYNQFRQHLIENYNAVECEEGEADDWLGISQEDGAVCSSCDKDLLQVPGHHFNTNTYTFEYATRLGELHLDTIVKSGRKTYKFTGTGFKWFAAQCVQGDRTDAIRGLPYFKTVELFERLSPAETEREAWETVKDIYRKSNIDILDIYKLDDSNRSHEQLKMEYLAQMAKLVWVARDKDSMYTPKFSDGSLLDYE